MTKGETYYYTDGQGNYLTFDCREKAEAYNIPKEYYEVTFVDGFSAPVASETTPIKSGKKDK